MHFIGEDNAVRIVRQDMLARHFCLNISDIQGVG